MKAWRVADARHPIWDGTGAAMAGGRWNSMGRGPIYAAETYSGALLEMLVKLGSLHVPPSYVYIEIDIPPDLAGEEIAATPEQMRKESFTKSSGDRWFDAKRAPVLKVPSVVTRIEHNILINPQHPQFSWIKPGDPKPVWWDTRLFKR